MALAPDRDDDDVGSEAGDGRWWNGSRARTTGSHAAILAARTWSQPTQQSRPTSAEQGAGKLQALFGKGPTEREATIRGSAPPGVAAATSSVVGPSTSPGGFQRPWRIVSWSHGCRPLAGGRPCRVGRRTAGRGRRRGDGAGVGAGGYGGGPAAPSPGCAGVCADGGCGGGAGGAAAVAAW